MLLKISLAENQKDLDLWKCPQKLKDKSAIEGLNGTDLKGKVLNVNEARPKVDNPGWWE